MTAKEIEPGCYVIQDDGPGIDGTPQDIARLFSIDRGLVSSKLWRKPQRGALGNGLRVVAGALIASGGGSLIIWTRDQCLAVTPLGDGGADVVAEPVAFPVGTRIEISFGPLLPRDHAALLWAEQAINMADGGAGYSGKSSAHWFDGDAFYELIHCSGARPVRDLVANLDGCTGAKAGAVASAFLQRPCASLTREETTELLLNAKSATTPPSIKRLGEVGEIEGLWAYHGRQEGVVTLGARMPMANIPFIVEAWAQTAESDCETEIEIYVNRTPITGEATVYRDSDKDLMIYGCNLSHVIRTPTKKGEWLLALNITAPFVPITTDSKAPDLRPFVDAIAGTLSVAIKRAHRNVPKGAHRVTQTESVLANLDEAIAKASGDGRYRFEHRQLLYAIRPIVMRETGAELKKGNFYKIITAYEAEHGEIPGIYRDNRGAIYHPHMGDGDIPVGTLMVENYKRPLWTFNKIVYIEKQGFFETLKAEKWPERYDCALLTGKGYTTRAIKDLVDHLAEHDEPVQVFCVHDADSAGTMIMQTLQEATPARGARLVEIINFGLEPWAARGMGLEAESFDKGDERRPVADYVLERADGAYWNAWLQSNRYELNAMTTPQFLSWLDAKMDEHGVGKVVPPASVITAEAEARLETELRKRITKRVLREANIDAQVAEARTAITLPREQLAPDAINRWLDENPDESWRDRVDELVDEVTSGDADLADDDNEDDD